MKPGSFAYYDPTTIEEALALLQELGDGAKVLAGGQSLVPVLNMRLARPAALVDLRRISGLNSIHVEGERLCIGALTRHSAVEHSELVARHCPLLQEAAGRIGHLAIRNRGTIGGSLAHADPAAELPAVVTALDGELVVASHVGSRTIPAREFFISYFTTSLSEGEILTEIRLPLLPPRTGTAFVEVARRHGDFALVGVACQLTLNEVGETAEVRLALTGVGPTPARMDEAEAALRGRLPTAEHFAEVGHGVIARAIDPESDIHASDAYRRQLAGELSAQALATAYERALQLHGGDRR